MSEKKIQIPILARVEGEGALELVIENNEIKKLQLRIYEPPRLFEKFLEGRYYYDVPDIVARICGICPVAYQMSAVHALENIFGIQISHWVREMRRLYYCGEWIESHGLHINFLAAPDYLGFTNALTMVKDHPDIIKRGVQLRKLGNQIVSLLGGRSVHPVGVCVGGFYHAPEVTAILDLLQQLRVTESMAADLVCWSAGLNLPEIAHDITYVSLSNPKEYPFNEGRLQSNHGLDLALADFATVFTEEQVAHSTALHGLLNREAYLVGPLARLNNNFKVLPPKVQKIIQEINLRLPTNNMFYSIIARAIEVYYSILEAIRILENYEYPTSPRSKEVVPKAGIGFGCTEAPRGTLWHSYQTDEQGVIKAARIVPPTSQNQRRIEEDLRFSLISYGLDKPDNELRLLVEKVIRNYDPCISCSTHYLRVMIERC